MSDRHPPWTRALEGRYRIEDELGAGGMGVVYRALDLKHRRHVAIKVLDHRVSAPEHAQRFLREIEIAASLNHPHISPVFDSGEAGDCLYYVMPLMEGDTLRDIMARDVQLPIDRVRSITRQLADALEHAHAKGVIHRDVKPANVLFADGHAVLADFGVARAMEEVRGDLTGTGVLPGTPLYMSPEQLSGDGTVDRRSDLYSLGCVAYEMLAGRRPFDGNSPMSVLARQVNEAPPALESLRPDVPVAVAAAVHRMLAVNPDDRFQGAADFARALDSETLPERPGRPRRSRFMAAAGAVVPIFLLVFIGLRVGGRGEDLTDRQGSIVVLPFGTSIQSPEEDALVLDLADELTRQLNRWDSVRAVPQVSLTGVAFDLGLDGPLLQDIDDGRRIAGSLGVETLLTLNVRIRGDSAELSAARFDPGGRSSPGQMLEARGPAADPFVLAAQIAHELLGLEGPVEAVERLRRQSSNAEALRAYSEGLRFLMRWRLADGQQAFERATALDGTFAMAHHYLAVALYWQGARDPDALEALGSEAARMSRAALRNADDLPSRDREHVVAFSRFLDGDYEGARQRYAGLLAADSTDAFAWLLGGIVEFKDPWLIERPDGSLRPRADWNAAVTAFLEATRLSPDFHLGYGHLFDIAGDVIRTVEGPRGKGLYRPRGEIVAPWEPGLPDPSQYEAFYPVYRDSIAWLSEEDFRRASSRELADGATRLLERSLRTLRRWAAYAPEEARPQAELAQWTLRQRSLLDAPQAPARLDSFATVALAHAERALSLTTDTLATDLARLANLYLATGAFDEAGELTERIRESGDAPGALPRSLINVFLHRGDGSSAVDLWASEGSPRRFIEDPETGALLGDGGAEPVVRRLIVFGMTGLRGPAVENTLADLDRLIAGGGPDMAPPRVIRRHQAPRIATALASAPEALARWRAAADLPTPFWEAIDPAAGEGLVALRAASLDEEPVDGVPPDPGRSYLLAMAALRVGEPARALQLFHRVDSIPLAVEDLDPAWGLKALSLYGRSMAYEALGDNASAVAAYRTFLETRAGAEDAPYVSDARRRLEALPAGNH